MATAVLIADETSQGQRLHSFKLQLASERVTARELILERVAHEVDEYNRSTPEYYQGLVQPAHAERVLNGYRVRERRRLDKDAQCARALEAFRGNGFLLLVDDRQVDDPEQEIVLRPDTEVRFLKLVPLVGG
jgi:hypothetical protein